MYFNGLPSVVKYSNCHHFAEDVQIHIIGLINNDLEIIHNLTWFDDKFNYSIHLNKLCSTVFGSISLEIAWALPINTTINNIYICLHMVGLSSII